MSRSNYILRKKPLGKGTFGTAYLAKSRDDGENYVMKVIDMHDFRLSDIKHAMSEVMILKSLNHPNIVALKEAFVENDGEVDNLHLVMEFVNCGDLGYHINVQKDRGTPFPPKVVLSWLTQLCLALKHVHDRKILHRDVKEANIFVGTDKTVKLGDFGIAAVKRGQLAAARSFCGTPNNFSPELVAGKRYTAKNDMWALGCVLYRLCTRRSPFHGRTKKALFESIQNDTPEPVPSLYGKAMAGIVNALLSKNPDHRPDANTLLNHPLLAAQREVLLSPRTRRAEFAHTVLHSDSESEELDLVSSDGGADVPALHDLEKRFRKMAERKLRKQREKGDITARQAQEQRRRVLDSLQSLAYLRVRAEQAESIAEVAEKKHNGNGKKRRPLRRIDNDGSD